MKVSVVIPVFNTEKYIEQCIQSCMIQEEVGQIIVINDGSTDRSDQIINNLAKKDSRIVILYHPNKENRGAGASRNLGIDHAQCELLNFLDADDYYHPGRFVQAIKTIEQEKIDGIFESIEVLQESDFPEDYPLQYYKVSQDTDPKDCLDTILNKSSDTVCIHGFTFRTTLIKNNKIKCLELSQGQELELLFEACIKGKVSLKSTASVGVRRLHAHNTILNKSKGNQARTQFFALWFDKMLRYNLNTYSNRYFFVQRLHFDPWVVVSHSWFVRNSKKLILAFYFLVSHPILVKKLF